MSISTLTLSGADNDTGTTSNLSCNLITVTGGSIVIDLDAPSPLDTRAAIVAATVTSGGSYLRDTFTASTTVGYSFWLKINTLPSAETEMANFMNGGSAQLSFRLTAAGKFKVATTAAVTLWTGTATASTGTWYLVRIWAQQDSAAGQFKFQFSSFSGGAFTSVEASGPITSVNTGTLSYNGFQVGAKRTGTMTANISLGGSRWVDQAATDLIPYHSRVGSGTAGVTVGTEQAGYHQQTGSGTAGITVGVSGAGLKRGVGSGTAGVTVGASGGGAKRSAGVGLAEIDVGASGLGKKLAAGAAVATITVGTSGVGSKRTGGSGTAGITVGAGGTGTPSHPSGGFGTAPIGIGAVGTGYSIRTGAGTAGVTVGAGGVGLKRSAGSGTAAVGLGVEGDGTRTSFGDGLAEITVMASGVGVRSHTGDGLAVIRVGAGGVGFSIVGGIPDNDVRITGGVTFQLLSGGWAYPRHLEGGVAYQLEQLVSP